MISPAGNSMIGRPSRWVAVGLAALVTALSSCAANPPPPIQSTQTTTPAATAETTSTNPVVVAIDDIGTGFNPHLVADLSPATVAVSSMVLPSPYRPALGPDGSTVWQLDSALMVSAEVTSTAPFTVTYVLRADSQWSDSAPIAAEDFRYLWQQMISAPGVVDPAGYALIRDVQSSGGGKTVTVTLADSYPAWRELFTSLLPSHLVKDSPGGFEEGLRESVPVSGGQFRIKSVDKGRDEILLERNDRYWGIPATPDQVLLRRGGSPSQLADSMRSGDAQVAQVRSGNAARVQLGAITGLTVGLLAQPRALEFVLNGRRPALADVAARRAVMGLLDPALLATVAAGGGVNDRQTRAQLLVPSDRGYAPTDPPPLGADRAIEALRSLGYSAGVPVAEPPAGTTPSPTTPTTGPGARGPLTLVIGTAIGDDIAAGVANTVADQLRAGGVQARVSVLDPTELYGTALTTGTVDAVVGWTRAGADPATALASRFGCGSRGTDRPGSSIDPLALSNLSGVCDPSLQGSFDRAIVGAADLPETIAAAEPALWALATVMPIIQDTSVVAVGPGVGGVSLLGPPAAGVFSGAAGWVRNTR